MSLFIILKIIYLNFKLLDILFLGKRTLIKVRRKGLMNVFPHYPLNCCSSVTVWLCDTGLTLWLTLCPTLWPPWTAAHQASCLSLFPRVCSKLMSIESVTSSNHLILCLVLLLLSSGFPSTRIFSSRSVLHIRWQM